MNLTRIVHDAEQMRAFGRALGQRLRAGDLVMLTGPLGAGKTTLTQGIGEALGVTSPVASPTFIVARVHPSQTGPSLIHVDAYRISSLDDLETLDLDTALEQAVVVVEWGEGLVEALSEDRLEITLERSSGSDVPRASDGVVDLTALDEGPRTLRLHALGPRMCEVVSGLGD